MPVVRFQNREPDILVVHGRADIGHVAHEVHQHAADRVEVGAALVLDELQAGRVLDFEHGGRRVDVPDAVPLRLDLGILVVMLVLDLAHDLLDDVLEGHDAADAAELVDDDRHVKSVRLHLAEEHADPLRLGDEGDRGPHELEDRAGAVTALLEQAEYVLGVENPLHVVGGLPVHGVTAVPALFDLVEHHAETGLHLERDHLHPRHHHLARHGVLELEHAVEKLSLIFGDLSGLLVLLDHVFDGERAHLRFDGGLGDHARRDASDGGDRPREDGHRHLEGTHPAHGAEGAAMRASAGDGAGDLGDRAVAEAHARGGQERDPPLPLCGQQRRTSGGDGDEEHAPEQEASANGIAMLDRPPGTEHPALGHRVEARVTQRIETRVGRREERRHEDSARDPQRELD